MANWIAGNWWQILCALVLLIGYIISMQNSVKTSKEVKEQLSDLKKDFLAHTVTPGLHRGPDFELRMLNIERQVESAGRVLGNIQDDVRALLSTQKKS